MLFEKKLNKIKFNPTEEITRVRINLEPKRENELQKINKIYSKEVFYNNKRLGRTKLIKMAIDNLINDIEGLSEDEAILYLRNLYKEAEF